MARVVFDNIDEELLEEQRQALIIFLCGGGRVLLSPNELELFEGLLNMLNDWADKRDGFDVRI